MLYVYNKQVQVLIVYTMYLTKCRSQCIDINATNAD